MSAVLWLLLAVPAAGGTALLLLAALSADRGLVQPGSPDSGLDRSTIGAWGGWAGTLVAAATLVLAVLAAAGRPTASAPFLLGIPAEFTVDGLGAAMVVMVAAVTLVVLLFSASEFGSEHRARFCGLILIFATAMLATVTATNLAVLLMGWEVMGAMSYALIAFHWRQLGTVPAAETAFLTTRTADLGLYLAAGAALAGAGSLSFGALPGAASPWLGLLTAGIIAAAAGKSAQLPLSYWLSAAMRGPSGVSALLHSATMVAAGGYLLLRLHPVLVASGFGAPLVAWLGALTALALGAVAVVQRDLKQLLAASTAAQIGFVVLAAGVAALAGGAAQLVAHAAVKSLLFLAAGAWLVALGTKDLWGLAGAARRHPVVGVTFTAGALTLAGLPPLALWTTKDLVLAGAKHELLALYLVGLAAAGLSALYAGRALVMVWAPAPPAPEYDAERPGTRTVGRPAQISLVLLAAAGLGLALLALPPVHDRLVGGAPPTGAELVISGVLAAGALGLALAWGRRTVPVPGLLRDWLGLHRAAMAVAVRPVLALSAALARADDRGVDTAVHSAAAGVRVLSRLAARFDDRVVAAGVTGVGAATLALAGQVRAGAEEALERTVSSVAAGARRLGALARAPQTGQLHAYYAQAVTLLLAAAILLAVLLA